MIHSAVIPVAGFGTRMLPAAKAVPKELLPILDKPTLQYVVEEAADAGCQRALLVNSKEKPAIESHFSDNPALQQRLLSGGKQALLESIESLIRKIEVESIYQPQPRGLGDAIAQAESQTANQPFMVMLGDTIFTGDPLPGEQLAEAYRQLGTSIIGVEEVPEERVSRYGIVGGTMIDEGVLKLNALVEKPSVQNAPSRYAIAARYVLTPTVFDCLKKTSPGKGGEIQLTDALQQLLKRETIHAVILKSHRHDIGNPIDWLKTNLLFAHNNKVTWQAIEPLLRSLLNS